MRVLTKALHIDCAWLTHNIILCAQAQSVQNLLLLDCGTISPICKKNRILLLEADALSEFGSCNDKELLTVDNYIHTDISKS